MTNKIVFIQGEKDHLRCSRITELYSLANHLQPQLQAKLCTSGITHKNFEEFLLKEVYPETIVVIDSPVILIQLLNISKHILEGSHLYVDFCYAALNEVYESYKTIHQEFISGLKLCEGVLIRSVDESNSAINLGFKKNKILPITTFSTISSEITDDLDYTDIIIFTNHTHELTSYKLDILCKLFAGDPQTQNLNYQIIKNNIPTSSLPKAKLHIHLSATNCCNEQMVVRSLKLKTLTISSPEAAHDLPVKHGLDLWLAKDPLTIFEFTKDIFANKLSLIDSFEEEPFYLVNQDQELNMLTVALSSRHSYSLSAL